MMRTGLRLRPLAGRDPLEPHRPSTPLELLFDLSAVVAFDQVGTSVAHALAAGRPAVAGLGLAATAFAVCWAWINFTWLASAYDTDDGRFRAATLVELVGVLTVAVGVQPFFVSLDRGDAPDPRVLVAGYVIMRVAAVLLWLRAAADDPAHRRTAAAYAILIPTAQLGWIALAIVRPSTGIAVSVALVLIIWELVLPAIAEARGRGTPWHPSHIAERYGLLFIIALGELLSGIADAAIASSGGTGWSSNSALILGEGALLTFALWWLYFTVPSAPILQRHRRRAFTWGYLHIPLFVSIIAIGSGLHLAAILIEEADPRPLPIVLALAIPVAAFAVIAFVLRVALLHGLRRLQVVLFLASLVPLVTAGLLARADQPVLVCTALVALSPLVVVIGHEHRGRQQQVVDVERALRAPVRHLPSRPPSER